MEQIAFEGSGSSDGYGDGYGDGSGSGSGSGGDPIASEAYYSALTAPYARSDAVIALWNSSADGRPANGGNLPPVKVGDIQETEGPLVLCKSGTLHATFNPGKWKGDRLWVVAMHGEIAIGEDKIGALKREILAELQT